MGWWKPSISARGMCDKAWDNFHLVKARNRLSQHLGLMIKLGIILVVPSNSILSRDPSF